MDAGKEIVPIEQAQPLIEVVTAQEVKVKRNIPTILTGLRELAAMAGEHWFYRYPVRSGGGGSDWIEGPSIKCANAVARLYGNCQIDTRVVEERDSWMIYARFVDLETGFSYVRPFQQRKDQSSIRSSNQARAQDIALQIGVSKAIRNVVTNALETYTTYAYEEARKNMVDRIGSNLDDYRGRVVDRLSDLKVDKARVERMIGRPSHEWLAPDIAKIIAQIQAINDGMATTDDAWPSVERTAGTKIEQLETVIRDKIKIAEAMPTPDEFGEVEIPKLPGGKKHDYPAYRTIMLEKIAAAPTPDVHSSFMDKNKRGLDTMKLVMPDLHQDIMTAAKEKAFAA